MKHSGSSESICPVYDRRGEMGQLIAKWGQCMGHHGFFGNDCENHANGLATGTTRVKSPNSMLLS